jgi:hypothetical protein
MTAIIAKVVSVSKMRDQYFVGAHVGSEIYEGAFDGLNFGENKPFLGWYYNGWLDLLYQQDPGFHAGQEFALRTNLVDPIKGGLSGLYSGSGSPASSSCSSSPAASPGFS